MKSQARLRLYIPDAPEAVMPRVAGKPFRCCCRANVFTKTGNVFRGYRYTCNACGRVYA
jgi:hypothetical protein